jgi:hypothetical protein
MILRTPVEVRRLGSHYLEIGKTPIRGGKEGSNLGRSKENERFLYGSVAKNWRSTICSVETCIIQLRV